MRSPEGRNARILELADAVGFDTLIDFAEGLLKARQAHPEFAESFDDGLKVVKSEMLEWESQAMLCKTGAGMICARRLQKTLSEGRDVQIVIARFASEFGEVAR